MYIVQSTKFLMNYIDSQNVDKTCTYLFQNSCKSAKILSNLQFKYIYMVYIKAPIGHTPIHTNSSISICCMNFQNINLIPILLYHQTLKLESQKIYKT